MLFILKEQPPTPQKKRGNKQIKWKRTLFEAAIKTSALEKKE